MGKSTLSNKALVATLVALAGCAAPDTLTHTGNAFGGYAGEQALEVGDTEPDAAVEFEAPVEAHPSGDGDGDATAAPFVPPPADVLDCCVDLYLCVDYCRPGSVPMLSEYQPGESQSLYCVVDAGQCDETDAGAG